MKRLTTSVVLLCALLPLHAYTVLGTRWAGSPVAMHLQLGGVSGGTLIDGSTSWGAVAEDALSAWNAVLTNVRFESVRDSTAARARGNSSNNVFFTSTVYGSAWDSRTLAVTLSSYFRATGTYAESDVLFNSGINWNSYRGAERTAANGSVLYDFRRVAMHEFGHVLGLGHPDVIGQVVTAIMNSTSEDIDSLQADDINGVRSIYDGSVASRPVFILQPAGRTVPVGQAVELLVTTTGNPAPAYQWVKNGTPITGATAATFRLSSAAVTDSGIYAVTASNPSGTTTSASATVTVNAPVSAPLIAVQPAGVTVPAGSPVTLTVTASGSPAPAYQWRRNGNALAGATRAVFSITAPTAADAGAYTVVVSNSAGSVVSATATVTVNAPPLIAAHPAGQAVVAGEPVAFVVNVLGTPPLAYQWLKDGTPVPGATSARFEIATPDGADRAMYSVAVTNAFGTSTSSPALLAVRPASVLTNLSIRASMAAGQTLIVGAVLGEGSKSLLVRAAGPALNAFGLVGMADPRLDVYSGATLIAANDNWPAVHSAAFNGVGAFAFAPESKDASILQSVGGSITIQAQGTGPGVLLVETYDSAANDTARLVNLSARNRVGTGADVLIAGFAIAGTGTKSLLIRAVGPTLATFGVNGALNDPTLTIVDAAGTTVASNDNWPATLSGTFTGAGAFPLVANSKDAAIVVRLNAGAAYTVLVASGDNTGGEALIEIYELF